MKQARGLLTVDIIFTTFLLTKTFHVFCKFILRVDLKLIWYRWCIQFEEIMSQIFPFLNLS